MRIAVVGSGIAGLSAAWLLSRKHEVVLFESEQRLGGHTHTHNVAMGGREFAVDTGFIVFNEEHYPLLTRLFDELRVTSQPTTMSFSVQDARNGLEYNAGTLGGLFCQPRNLFSPPFLKMVRDIKRFYREAHRLLESEGAGPTLGNYLRDQNYSPMFIDDHLIPMASALWSSPSVRIMDFPAKYLVRFMRNHHMLQVSGRPQWRTVTGGSSRYVEVMRRHWKVQSRPGTAVLRVMREDDSVRVATADGEESFDQVVMACHSDEALALLGDPSASERDILSAMPYQDNDTVLHTDARLLPRNRKAWAAWNAYIPMHLPANDRDACTVSYCMNILQSLDAPEPLIVTLNRSAEIDPEKIIARMNYRHPVYTQASVDAQGRRAAINGQRGTWFVGAYWRYGFHEDGIRSAISVASALGVDW
ncbi:MAG: FAD-dependent oxidoreductase [Lysobacteraceae bacterium]